MIMKTKDEMRAITIFEPNVIIRAWYHLLLFLGVYSRRKTKTDE